MTTVSNSMESQFSLIYKDSSELPFTFKQARLFDWLPFSMVKNPSNKMKGMFEILPIPTKRIVIDMLRDTYVRSDYDIMNYGTDGSVMAYTDETATVQAYFGTDLSSVIPSVPVGDLLSVTLEAYCQSYTPPNSTSTIYPMSGDWFENDVNWFHRPSVGTTAIGTIVEDAIETYVSSTDIKDYILGLDSTGMQNFAVAVENNEPGSFFLCESKESNNKPRIVLTVIDREAMRQYTYSELSFKIVPRIRANTDLLGNPSLPFSIDLHSKNVMGELPFVFGVSKITTQVSSETKVSPEIPFSLSIQKNGVGNLSTNLGVNNTVAKTTMTPNTYNELPLGNFTAATPAQSYLQSSLGIVTKSFETTADVPTIAEVPFGPVIPKIPAVSNMTFVLASKYETISSTLGTINVTDLPFGDCVPKISEVREISTLFGAKHETNSTTVEVLAMNDLEMTLTVRRWDDSQITFVLAAQHGTVDTVVNLAAYNDLPLQDMNVLDHSYVSFDLNVEEKAFLAFGANDVVPVSILPFEFNVISPYLQFTVIPRTTAEEFLPMDLVARVRQANDISMTFSVTQGGSYVFIM